MPKLECKSLELEPLRGFIIHSLKNLARLFPKTNDSRGSPQLLSGETMTAGLYSLQVSIRYKLLKFFPLLAYARKWHMDKTWIKLKTHNFCKMTLMERKSISSFYFTTK